MKVNLLNRNTSFCKLCILQRQLEATSMCTIEINKIEITIRLIEIDISLTLTIPGHVESSHARGRVGGRSPRPWIMAVYYGLNYGCKGSDSPTRSLSFSYRSNDYWEPVLMCSVPPPIGPLFRKYVRCPPSPIGTLFRKYVRCPHLPVYTFSVQCPPSQFISASWTIWLCLGFWAKLIIWQVPACKMKPSSTCILECGTPSWACFPLFFVRRNQKNLFCQSWQERPLAAILYFAGGAAFRVVSKCPRRR